MPRNSSSTGITTGFWATHSRTGTTLNRHAYARSALSFTSPQAVLMRSRQGLPPEAGVSRSSGARCCAVKKCAALGF